LDSIPTNPTDEPIDRGHEGAQQDVVMQDSEEQQRKPKKKNDNQFLHEGDMQAIMNAQE